MILTPEKFDRLLKKYLPKEWEISYEPSPGEFAMGCADGVSKKIHIPDRDSVECLLIFLHEVGHVVYRHSQASNELYWRQEYQAERYANTIAKREGVDVSEYQLKKSRAYVRRHYRSHLKVCKLYRIKSKRPAKPGELKWMEI